MLFKKTLKVASATALWMVALLGANSAMAQTTYSAEALLGMEGDESFGVNSPDADGISVDFPIGARTAFHMRENAVYVRVSATDVLEFARVPGLSIETKGEGEEEFGNAAIVGGGAATADGKSAYVWMVPLSSTRTDSLQFVVTIAQESDDDAMVTGIGDGGVALSVYDEAAAANFGDAGARMVPDPEVILEVVRSVSVAPMMSELTASAASRFTAIKGMEEAQAPYEVSFGGFNITVNDMHHGPDGMTLMANLDDVADPPVTLYTQVGLVGTTRFYGDGGFAFAEGFRLAADPGDEPDCSGVGAHDTPAGAVEGDGDGIMTSPLTEVAEGEDAPDANEVIGGIKVDPWYLCVSISNENEAEIPEADYQMDVRLGAAMTDTRPFPAVGEAGLGVASIEHDGTTVQIPYLTTYDQYNQRIVIVNRTKDDVGYSITFSTEDGVTATPGMDAEGTADGKTTTVLSLRNDDVVTIEGGTRASAEVILLADPTMVDVATQVINTMGGGTDTVVLESR